MHALLLEIVDLWCRLSNRSLRKGLNRATKFLLVTYQNYPISLHLQYFTLLCQRQNRFLKLSF